MRKFIFSTDLHYGYERRNGHKSPLHDLKAWQTVVKFAADFKPDVWILGGDMLDCGAISHHTKHKPGQTEGLRLVNDAAEGRAVFIAPVERLAKERVYFIGNHEHWLDDLRDEMPALEGLVDVRTLLGLQGWQVVPQGDAYHLGKLTFIHGDTLSGGEHVAKSAVIHYERSMRFGHFHTYQTYTKTSPLHYKHAKTGMAVPCLCGKMPSYGKGRPNRWVQGFCYGWVHDNGHFNDHVVIILDGKATINGKVYAS